MANNPYPNKVQFGNQTVMDISDTTATAEDVASGKYFYAASGAKTLGTRTGGGSYVLTYSDNSVGTAVVGTAVTEEPNYTPSGDIELQTGTVAVNEVTGATLNYSFSNYKLSITGIALQTSSAAITIPTSAIFKGSGVKFEIEEETV